MMCMRRFVLVSLLISSSACGPDELPPPEGVDVPAGPCGHALYVVSSDYQSSSVSIVGYDGAVLSTAILHSGSANDSGGVALSRDVTAPTTRTSSGSVVLLDREVGMLTLLDPVAATVTRQIPVRTGFDLPNPQDVLEITPDKIYVSRYGSNPNPGAEPFDEGNDILIVNPRTGSITGSIGLADAMGGAEEGILPHPSRMLASEDRVYALLSAYSLDYSRSGDGRIVTVDPSADAIESVITLDGMRGCSGFALSPSGKRLAVACSGTFALSNTPSVEDSGVVVVDLAGAAPSIAHRVEASELGGDPLGLSVAFLSDDVILAATMGKLDDSGALGRPDRLLEITLGGDVRELLRSESMPVSLGDVRCEAACGVCFAADADHNVVQRIEITDGRAGTMEAIPLDDGIGLPPRFLGAY